MAGTPANPKFITLANVKGEIPGVTAKERLYLEVMYCPSEKPWSEEVVDDFVWQSTPGILWT